VYFGGYAELKASYFSLCRLARLENSFIFWVSEKTRETQDLEDRVLFETEILKLDGRIVPTFPEDQENDKHHSEHQKNSHNNNHDDGPDRKSSTPRII